jgi:hypothetical protein
MKILSKIFLVRMKIRNGHAASFHSVPLDCRSSSSSSLRLFDLHFPFRYGLHQLIPASLILAQKSRCSCSSSTVRKRFCLVMSFQTDRLMRCHLPFLEMLIWILTHFHPMVFTRQVRYPNPSPRIPVFRWVVPEKVFFHISPPIPSRPQTTFHQNHRGLPHKGRRGIRSCIQPPRSIDPSLRGTPPLTVFCN